MSQARGATEEELLCSGQGASQDRQRYLASRGAPLPFLSSRELQRARRGAASQSVRKQVPLRRRSGAAEGWDAGIGGMTRSGLIKRLAAANPQLYLRDIERIVDTVFEQIGSTLARGDRVELRGFGAFSTRARGERLGRNPRTGNEVAVPGKVVAYALATTKGTPRACSCSATGVTSSPCRLTSSKAMSGVRLANSCRASATVVAGPSTCQPCRCSSSSRSIAISAPRDGEGADDSHISRITTPPRAP